MKSLGSLLILLLMTIDLLGSSKTDISLSGPQGPVFVGEPFALELMVKRCGLVESESPLFVEPKIRHIWLKKVCKTIHTQDGNCRVSKRRYVVSAQQSGQLAITPVEVRLAIDEEQADAWGNLKTERYWESHYSNDLELQVKRLPEDTALVGEFTLRLDVENRDVAADAVINAEIIIEGIGNFEDISVAVPTISGVNIFTEEPKLENAGSSNNERWRQKVSMTATSDFIIPSMPLVYFDLKDERLKTVQTEAVPIRILGGKRALLPKVAETETVSKVRGDLTLWMVVAGIIGIVFLIGITARVLRGRHQIKKVSYRDDKALLHLLLLHKDDEGIDAIIEQLEASVYEGKEISIDPKELKALIKKYQ